MRCLNCGFDTADLRTVLPAVIALLQREGRISYKALQYEFGFDDALLEALRAELTFKGTALDDRGQGLVWPDRVELSGPFSVTNPQRLVAPYLEAVTAAVPASSPPLVAETEVLFDSPTAPGPDESLIPQSQSRRASPPIIVHRPEAERRQVTVVFCDLVDSTPLAERLDPEELRTVIRSYQEACATVIDRFEGYIAQYLGDGVLLYFGYPVAHEDDAQRAVRAGLDIVAAVHELNAQLPRLVAAMMDWPLRVRIGIHTGLVVVGALGKGERQEQVAVGETPNIAARLQGLTAPNTVVISDTTARLIGGAFDCRDLGRQALKGVSFLMQIYQVLGESGGRHRDAAYSAGPPLVDRTEEVTLLLRRWQQAKEGHGQVVLLSGEPGIGKSALVDTLRATVRREGGMPLTFRCSPYHRNSALYPIVEHLQRFLQFERDEAPNAKLAKLEQVLGTYRFFRNETLPLFAALFSLPLPEDRYPPLTLSPQQQKQYTFDSLAAWLAEETERAPVLAVWEDVHWADASTLEVLGFLVDQASTAQMLTVLTFRPEFAPPWPTRSHLTLITLNPLESQQVEAMVNQLAREKPVPPEVLRHIVNKTDGVPVFVEELTKMILESDLLRPVDGRYELSMPLSELTIPSTLQDSLMARLDRHPQVREVAQLGAVLGREFTYEMLQALTAIEEESLQERLAQLVGAELLYQRGRPPRARYIFKHALIQDAAYTSLLRTVRQEYHRRIAQLFERQFPEIVETQPELVAHHYTEARLNKLAVVYWHKAGQIARQRSAHAEATNHLRRGIELLLTLPNTLERVQQELTLQIALGASLTVLKSPTVPEVEDIYARARTLCKQVGDFSQLSRVLFGQWAAYMNGAEHKAAQALAEQLLKLAQQANNPTALLVAHHALGSSLWWQGELLLAQKHLDQALAIDASESRSQGSFMPATTARVTTYSYDAFLLWFLGYPDRALQRSHEALTLARKVSHPYSVGFALHYIATVHVFRREAQEALVHGEAEIAVGNEHGFALWLAAGTVIRGVALAAQGQGEEGIKQLRQGIEASRATGSKVAVSTYLAWLAEVYQREGQVAEGLLTLAEALDLVSKTGERFSEAEMYRLKGELLLLQEDKNREATDESEKQLAAEECFTLALEIAGQQKAKSLELRAAMSLGRLWQKQGKKDEAHRLLAELYGWFTEGFDTRDLQQAKALLEELV